MSALRVALAGKGGAGKSTVAGTLARLLGRRGHRVLALDSDPMPGMAISLGLGAVNDAMLVEAVEQDPEGRWRLRRGVGAARAVQRFAVDAPDGVRFLQFGKADADGLAGVMASMRGFGLVAHRLASDSVMTDWTIVADLAAGTRQPAFNLAPYADTYLVVVEPTSSSLATARRADALASQRGAMVSYVASKVRDSDDVAHIEASLEANVTAAIPFSQEATDADRRGVALLDHAPRAAAVEAVAALADTLESRAAGSLGS